MRLKLYRATSVKEAMALARAELGLEALILSTRRIGEGVELTAALEPAEEIPPAKAPAEADFAYHGIPPAIAARLSGADLAQALARVLRFGTLPLAAGRALLLVGQPGAGKTLTIARLATRLVLCGTKPLVITADGRRAGAAEELAAYTRLLELSLMVASRPDTLARAVRSGLEQSPPATPVLVDSAGINPFDRAELAALQALAQACEASPVLVMPAGLHPEEAAEHAAAFAPLGARHLLPTRLDLARRIGSVITASLAADLTLTEAGIGAGATDSLTPLTPAFLAERLRRSPPSPNRNEADGNSR